MKKWMNLFLLLAGLQAAAQPKTFLYDGRVQAGLLEGEAGSAFQLQTVQGVQWRTWSAGVGAGLDYYHARSFPLFLELRKLLDKGKQAAFVYADGGYNFPWLTPAQKEWSVATTSGGLYADAGIGYQIPVLKKSLLFFAAGYSQKNYSTRNVYPVMIDIYPPPPPSTYKMEYQLRRLSIKTGLRF